MSGHLLWLAALGQAGCYLGLVSLGDLRGHIPETICFYGTAFFLYVYVLRQLKALEDTAGANRCLTLLICLAVFYRLVLLCSDPSLSDDIYRYVWEGTVMRSGHNPFSLAPDSPELAHLRNAAVFPQVSRPNLTAIYPPLAQFIFAGAGAVSASVVAMKAVFMLFDLGTVWLLMKTLSCLGKNPLQAAAYALNPLVIVEFSGSGHLDSAAIFFMMLGLYACLKKRELLPAAGLAAGFLVKLVPALLLPLVLTKKKVTGFFLFLGLSCAAFLPFIDAGDKLYASLFLYADNWSFNGPFYTPLLLAVPDNQLARRIAAALFCCGAAGIYYAFIKKYPERQTGSMIQAGQWLLGLLLVLSPVVHPWYVCWIVPLAAITMSRAWLLLSGTVFLSYWVLRGYAQTGLWREEPLVMVLEYVPFFMVLVYDWVRSRMRVHSYAE